MRQIACSLLFFCGLLLGCDVEPRSGAADLFRVAPPIDMAAAQQPDASPPSRLHELPGEDWWWWYNPNGTWRTHEVNEIWGAIEQGAHAPPYSFRPQYDRQLEGRCLFYRLSDGLYHCVPAWPQQDRQLGSSTGFYVASSKPCWYAADYRFAIPPQNDRRWLLLYDESEDFYRVFEAIAETNPTSFSWNGRTRCDPATSDLKYFDKGAEVEPDVFSAKL